MVPQNCSVTHILQNIFLCILQNKDIHTGLELLGEKMMTQFSVLGELSLYDTQCSDADVVVHKITVVVKVHRSSTWVKVQIRILKYYSSKSKSTAFSILLEWKYKSTQFFMYLSKKVLIDRFILQFYIDYCI